MKKILVLICLLIPLKISAISTSAKSAILMDMDSGRIFYAKNINSQQSVASISKILTAVVAIDNGNLKNKVTVGNEIKKAYGSGIYIKEGEKLTLQDLLYGLMLRSGNDAALAIANNVSKNTKSFVKKMNEKAQELDMKNSLFRNPHGLDQEDGGNISTAYDMAKLTSYAMKNKNFKKIVATEKYTLKTNKNTYVWHNKNKLLYRYKYTTGGKTGFTKIARRTLVTTASKNNLNLVVVTLNDGNDFTDHENLFEYAFNNYTNYKILSKGFIKIKKENYYKKHKLYIKNDYNYPLSIDEKDSIRIKYQLKKIRKLKNNSKVGTAKIYFGDKLVHDENIYLKYSNKKSKGWF